MLIKRWVMVCLGWVMSAHCCEAALHSGVLQQIRWVGIPTASMAMVAGVSLDTKVGRSISERRVYDDIHRLYQLGCFQRIEATTNLTTTGVVLTFLATVYPAVTKVEYRGNRELSMAQLNRLSPPQLGGVVSVKQIDEWQQSIESLYRSRGYDLAKVLKMSITPSGTVAVELSEGRIRSIQFSGLYPANLTSVFLRELKSKPGGYFNTNRVKQDRLRLLRLGYFEEVLPATLMDSVDGRDLVLDFPIRLRKQNKVDAGFEYTDKAGENPITGFIRSDYRHLILPSDYLSLKIQVAYQNQWGIQGYSVRYFQPWLFNWVPLAVNVGSWQETRSEFLTKDLSSQSRVAFNNVRSGSDVTVVWMPLDDLKWTWRYLHESVEPKANIPSYLIRSLSWGMLYQTVQDSRDPRNGVLWSLTHEIGGRLGDIELGGLHFQRTVSQLSGYWDLHPDHMVAARWMWGTFVPHSTGTFTFENEGFVLGGPNTLRGYRETAPPFLGNTQSLLNIETRHRLSSLFTGVLFWDIGYAGSGEVNVLNAPYRSSFGLGVRFSSPVGPLRFDVAYGQEWMIHFGLGHVF